MILLHGRMSGMYVLLINGVIKVKGKIRNKHDDFNATSTVLEIVFMLHMKTFYLTIKVIKVRVGVRVRV